MIKRSVPDEVVGVALADLLRSKVAGLSTTGDPLPQTAPRAVVWVDGGDEVLVHLDSLATRIVGSAVLVSIDLETDEVPRSSLVVVFALGRTNKAGLVATTDALPRGNGLLAARWGVAVREAAWSALLALSLEHATERNLQPHGLVVADGRLSFIADAPPARARP